MKNVDIFNNAINTIIDNVKTNIIAEIDALAQINALSIQNSSDYPLLVITGETVTGGKQDRAVSRHNIIKPKSDKVKLNVYCVEKGRWAVESEETLLFGSHNILAATTIRKNATYNKEQSVIWAGVDTILQLISSNYRIENSENTEENKSSNYNKGFNNSNFLSDIDKYFSAVSNGLPDDSRLVGLMLVINNRIRVIDIFINHTLFNKLKNKLIKSYITDGLLNGKENNNSLSKETLLSQLKEIKDKEGLVSENEELKDDTAGLLYKDNELFEGVDVQYEGIIVHRNYYSKEDL